MTLRGPKLVLAVLSIVVSACTSGQRVGQANALYACPPVLRADGTGLVVRCAERITSHHGHELEHPCTVENRFPQRVEGIRYVLGWLAPSDDPGNMQRYQQGLNVALEPGETKQVIFEPRIKSIYLGGDPAGCYSVRAAPIKLGGELVPLTDGW